jgi:hypothetical protein
VGGGLTTVRRFVMLKGGGAIAALLLLAVLAGSASPGFPLAKVPGAVSRKVTEVLRAGGRPAPPAPAERAVTGASPFALGDIPRAYLAHYLAAARTCPKLTWQVLAGIGKVESDHGRSSAPGVHTGLNRAGCCAGPMQFNLTNGPPSTWDAYGRGASPYDPGAAIPAAARKLCANGLALRAEPPDPCPQVLGSPAVHLALKRYNNACWYVHEVVTLSQRYTAAVTVLSRSRDPFVVALTHNPRLTTTRAHGCDPAADLASGRVDRHAIRVSCLRTGHSTYVQGTRRVSNHTVWRAVDIDRVDGQPVGPASPAARALATWLDRLDGPLRPAEIGSPFTIGHRPWFTDEGHQAHLHIGYSKRQTPG